jgi:guanine nucleotide-binding protein G(I)/G(S)/G(T) subunit beta-1
MGSITEKINAARSHVETLKDEIRSLKYSCDDMSLQDIVRDREASKPMKITARRCLKGHFAKVYAMHWAEAKDKKNYLVSASQDGKLIIWNAMTTNKVTAIPLRSSWVMTCAFSPGGNTVACGGLDNICSVYSITQKDAPTRATRELSAHTGYLSCCRFVNDRQILTSSGDQSCMLWDIETGTLVDRFDDHAGDVMSLCPSPTDKSVFISGGCDTTCKLWDIRTARCIKTFVAHTSDVNSVHFFPNGQLFASGSDDASCRLFDIRAYRELKTYIETSAPGGGAMCGITSVTFSNSGRFLIAGYDDYHVRVWDTLKGNVISGLVGHDNRVSCVGMNRDGTAMATGSWDSLLKVWA